jgi:hypothetical protein
LKYVCEKLKNGNKCCGCVGDKNAKAKSPNYNIMCCTAHYPSGASTGACEGTEAAARAAVQVSANKETATSIACEAQTSSH